MSIFVDPKHLREVLKNISVYHKRKVTGVLNDDDEEIKQLIIRLANASEKRLEDMAKLLTAEQITLISRYIPNNRYSVKLRNLFTIIEKFSTDDDLYLLFKEWLDYYDNHEVHHFLRFQLLNARKNSVSRFFRVLRIDQKRFQNWMIQENVLDYLCETINPNMSYKNYKKQLEMSAVFSETRLSNDCLGKFYLYCGAQSYLNLEPEKLKKIFNSYEDSTEKWLFVKNFIKQLSLNELVKFEVIYYEIERRFQIRYNDFENYLRNNQLFDKYTYWGRYIQIQKAFQDPDRRNFWKNYIKTAQLEINTKSNSIAIKFNDLVITEFMGQAAGPAYIYEKQYYMLHVEYKFKNYKKGQFQQFEYGLSLEEPRPKGFLERMPHLSGWQNKFSNVLYSYGITQTKLQ